MGSLNNTLGLVYSLLILSSPNSCSVLQAQANLDGFLPERTSVVCSFITEAAAAAADCDCDCVRACVCVCVCERERERERGIMNSSGNNEREEASAQQAINCESDYGSGDESNDGAVVTAATSVDASGEGEMDDHTLALMLQQQEAALMFYQREDEDPALRTRLDAEDEQTGREVRWESGYDSASKFFGGGKRGKGGRISAGIGDRSYVGRWMQVRIDGVDFKRVLIRMRFFFFFFFGVCVCVCVCVYMF